MAQLSCPDCGQTLSQDQETCPNCGFPVADYLHGYRQEAPGPVAPVPEVHVTRCPICGSEDLLRLSALDACAKVFVFGIMGAGDLGKTWECQDCGSKF